MFSKKKATLEDLLSELSTATLTLNNETLILEGIESKYTDAYSEYLKFKHEYENALATYIRHGGPEYAQKEYEARTKFSNSSKNLSRITSDFNTAQIRVKKAKKVYNKLQKLVAQKENSQMGL